MSRELTKEEKKIIKRHWQWLRKHPKGVRADFSGMDLSYTNLSHLDLSRAHFEGANLTGACLSHSNLYDANMSEVDMTNAKAEYTNFEEAALQLSQLRGATMCRANFRSACLYKVKAPGADLVAATLDYADCGQADFTGANLTAVTFRHAGLTDTIFTDAQGLAILDDAPERLVAVARAALASPDALRMRVWHTCDTTYCICGWGEFQGGPLAKLIIQTHGETLGGLMLLGVEAYEHFFVCDDVARMFLQAVLKKADGAETSLADSPVNSTSAEAETT